MRKNIPNIESTLPTQFMEKKAIPLLPAQEEAIIQAFFDYHRTPIWIFHHSLELRHSFFYDMPEPLKGSLAAHIQSLISRSPDPTFDILCYEKELYYLFTFERMNEPHYLVGGPMLLSSIYQAAEMKTLSFSSTMNGRDLNLLVDNLPVVSLNSFSSCLRIMLLLMRNSTLSYEEICSYKLSDLTDSFRNALIIDLFDHQEEYRAHTPYSHEIALLNCIKEGDLTMLESLYRTLPDIKYGNMSNHSNPVRQLFYGCISNTTLATRYAIEGGLDEETAFTLSDLYIKRMEACRTLYELHAVNEKMAMDFTRHVSEAKALIQPKYSAAIRKCIESITGNRQEKVSLAALAKEVNLTPHYLSFLFQKETGQTIRSFVEETRINKAKELLIYSQLSYSDISQSLFFSSQSYFISVFKRRVGLTPKKYRDLHSKSNR